ncbi:Rpn family recombination-promoting nuclease/putative transposase [Planktothrix mougeotii]|uniref:Rpn family recombination-promoting nuclease/putative transposase n=1 Tax=Planktothrix mougeotii LEGE 06226 TaxID=1828728 RepID=A0ABR9U882_9CYAN|nr:Rpn family recombination-promoting nuclease/putative transposase [Planktothrix mougeotii]MBE9142658.1 Rpn family recombination-promoting nuclease/putative transposase [Planktothrix mougeotii LEGE 06226]
MFDSICKFLAENYSQDLASWLLGSPVALTDLSPQELSLEPIRADSLILLQSDDLVLHTEFQTEPDAKIPFRMLDYRVRVYRRFPNKVMRQVVIYLGQTNSPLVQENSFRLENTFHQFEVIRLWEQPPEGFLSVTGLLPFAVLSQTDDPTMILSQVAEVIGRITDQQVQNNLTAASAILAGLVLNKDTVKRILRSDLMRNSVIYQEILQEGKREGKREGKLEAKEEIALNLLRMGLSLEQVVQVTGLSLEEVQSL